MFHAKKDISMLLAIVSFSGDIRQNPKRKRIREGKPAKGEKGRGELGRKGRDFMRYDRYLGALLFLLMFFSTAFSQDEVIDLNHEELGRHSRPLVKFNHERHQEVITECIRCHHDYDERMTNIGGEGQYCAECHSNGKEKNAVLLVKAFHMQCKGCHEGLLERGQRSGPIMCGQCHRR